MKYLKEIGFQNIEQILFFDIETISILPELLEDSPYFQSWQYKMRNDESVKTLEDVKTSYFSKAPLYPAFGRIATISLGFVYNGTQLRMKEYKHNDEKELLEEFFKDVDKLINHGKKFLSGFSLIGFDIPFVSFRCIVHGIPVHPYFDVAQLAPWNVKHVIDCQKLLEGTGFAKISLVNACIALGIGSPKTNLNGGEVNTQYWINKDVDSIAKYCSQDVLATANIFAKYIRVPLLEIDGAKKDVKIETKYIPVLEKALKGMVLDKKEIAALKKEIKALKKNDVANWELIKNTILAVNPTFKI